MRDIVHIQTIMPLNRRILTDVETELITQKKYDELIEQQKKLDAEIDAQVR